MKLKTILTALTAVLLSSVTEVKAQVKFMDYKVSTLEEVLQKAQVEHKNIFIDIWTPWCGVCKMMDRWVFPRKDVGDYFNKNFINLSFDAENPKWVAAAKKFNATAFPTMLIVNPQGEVIMNIDNLGVPMESDATGATSPVGQRLMQQAGLAQSLVTMPDTAFLNKQTVAVLRKLSPAFDTKVFGRIISLKDQFLKQYPNEFNGIVDDALGTAAVNMVSKSGHAVNTHKDDQYRSIVEALNLPQKQSQLLSLDLNIAIAMRKWQRVITLAKNNKQAMTPVLYATIMDEMAGSCSDKALLRSALTLCQPAVSSASENSRIGKFMKEAYSNLKTASK